MQDTVYVFDEINRAFSTSAAYKVSPRKFLYDAKTEKKSNWDTLYVRNEMNRASSTVAYKVSITISWNDLFKVSLYRTPCIFINNKNTYIPSYHIIYRFSRKSYVITKTRLFVCTLMRTYTFRWIVAFGIFNVAYVGAHQRRLHWRIPRPRPLLRGWKKSIPC